MSFCAGCGQDHHHSKIRWGICDTCRSDVIKANNPQPPEPKSQLLAKYGIDEDDYAALLAKQDGCCGICKKPPRRGRRLCVDHDHVTLVVRGLLCSKCNSGLGMFQDSLDVVRSAVRYLEET